MPLINTEGLTIIGEGSQWFWAMLSFLAIPITGYAIYSQLRITRSLRARSEVEELDREWDSERLLRSRLELLRAIRDGDDPAHLPPGPAVWIGVFWDRVGELVRGRHLDIRSLHGRWSRICQVWWAGLAPLVSRARAEHGMLDLYGNFEWLAERMAELDLAHGKPPFDPASPTVLLDSITVLEGQLSIEEALRSVAIAPSQTPVSPRRRPGRS